MERRSARTTSVPEPVTDVEIRVERVSLSILGVVVNTAFKGQEVLEVQPKTQLQAITCVSIS